MFELNDTDLSAIAGGDGDTDDVIQQQIDQLRGYMDDPNNLISEG